MKILVQANAYEAAKAGANFIAAKAREVVSARGRFVMAVSGGHVPRSMFRLLAEQDMPWTSIHIVQVDERVAPEGDPDRNLTHLEKSLLAHVPLPRSQVHAMPVNKIDLDKAAATYARMLQDVAGSPPVLDLVHLGLGTDGHTASLVPDDKVLEVADRDVALTGFYQGRWRMTLTFPIINRANCILWLITGSEMRDVFQRVCRGDPSIPASQIRRDIAVVIADEVATDNADSINKLNKLRDARRQMRRLRKIAELENG